MFFTGPTHFWAAQVRRYRHVFIIWYSSLPHKPIAFILLTLEHRDDDGYRVSTVLLPVHVAACLGSSDVTVITSGQIEHADSHIGKKSSSGTGRSLHATENACALSGAARARAAAPSLHEEERRRERDWERESFTDNACDKKNVPGLPQFAGKKGRHARFCGSVSHFARTVRERRP